jgi:hypothetical protein
MAVRLFRKLEHDTPYSLLAHRKSATSVNYASTIFYMPTSGTTSTFCFRSAVPFRACGGGRRSVSPSQPHHRHRPPPRAQPGEGFDLKEVFRRFNFAGNGWLDWTSFRLALLRLGVASGTQSQWSHFFAKVRTSTGWAAERLEGWLTGWPGGWSGGWVTGWLCNWAVGRILFRPGACMLCHTENKPALTAPPPHPPARLAQLDTRKTGKVDLEIAWSVLSFWRHHLAAPPGAPGAPATPGASQALPRPNLTYSDPDAAAAAAAGPAGAAAVAPQRAAQLWAGLVPLAGKLEALLRQLDVGCVTHSPTHAPVTSLWVRHSLTRPSVATALPPLPPLPPCRRNRRSRRPLHRPPQRRHRLLYHTQLRPHQPPTKPAPPPPATPASSPPRSSSSRCASSARCCFRPRPPNCCACTPAG